MKKNWQNRLLILFALLTLTGVSVAIALENNQITSVTVTPDPIKLGYVTTIKYTTVQTGFVFINVYKESGEFVRNLLNNSSKIAGTYSLTWDGKDSKNVLVPDGKYNIAVEFRDSAGGTIGLVEMPVVAARLPVISSVKDGPKDPFNPAVGEESTLTYTLSSDALVTVTVLKGLIPVATVSSNTFNPAGSNTVIWDGRDNAGNLLPDAAYTYQVDAVSQLVPAFKSTNKTALVVVEKEPPQITGFSVSANPLKIAAGTVSFKYTLSENAKVALKVYDSSGGLVRTIQNGTAKIAGLNTSTWDIKNDLLSYIDDGTYTAAVSAVDNYGKVSDEVKLSFTAAAPPAISNLALTPNPFNPGNGNAAINFKITKNADITVKIMKGTTAVKTIVLPKQPAGDVSVPWNGTDTNNVPQGDAAYTVQVTAASTLVPAFATTVSSAFSIEASAPSITALSLTPAPFKLYAGSLSIRYTLSENAVVYVNVYTTNGTLVRKLATGQAKLAGLNSLVWDGKDDQGNVVPDGTYTVKITAMDSAGNTGEAAGSVTGAAVPAISNPAFSPSVFNPPVDGKADVDFTVTSAAYVNVSILKGLTVVKNLASNMLVSQGTANHLEWDGTDNANKLLADGPYTCQIEGANPKEPTFKFVYKTLVTIEAVPPSLTGVLVSPAIIKVGATTTFKYTVSEAAKVIMQVYDAQGLLVRAFPTEVRSVSGTYSRVWDAKNDLGTAVPAGSYTLRLNAVDNFDNPADQVEALFTVGDIPVIANASAMPAIINVDALEQTRISFVVPVSSRVSVTILDSLNRSYKSVCANKDVTGPFEIFWDGFGTLGVCNPGTYTYKIEAISIVGAFRAVPVTGSIVVKGTPGSKPKKCTDCHTTYPTAHPTTNCAGCHGPNAPLGVCTTCHSTPKPHILPNMGFDYHSSAIDPRSCLTCHNANFSAVPSHPNDLTGLHIADLSADCQKCHQASISVEHPRRLDDNGKAYDCNTCHANTDPVVVQAIVNKDKNCGACHKSAVNHDALHSTTLIDANCTTVSGCHKQSLTQEHLNNPVTQTNQVTGQPKNWTCDTCHANVKPNVVGAIASGNMHCAACHSEAHNFRVAETVPADISLYPEYQWSAPLDAGLWQGETKVPDEFLVGGRVVISNRLPGITGSDISSFYRSEMLSQGWSAAPAISNSGPAANLVFVKDKHKVLIWTYAGSSMDDPAPLAAGWRVEIVYK